MPYQYYPRIAYHSPNPAFPFDDRRPTIVPVKKSPIPRRPRSGGARNGGIVLSVLSVPLVPPFSNLSRHERP